MLQSVLAFVGLTVSPLVIITVGWLIFCARTQRRLPTDDAVKVIEAAGKWFPLRLRSLETAGRSRGAEEEQRRDRAA